MLSLFDLKHRRKSQDITTEELKLLASISEER